MKTQAYRERETGGCENYGAGLAALLEAKSGAAVDGAMGWP